MPTFRRPIEVLLSRLKLEPTIWDVVVEGPRDADLINWFLRSTGRGRARAYPIDEIDVPPALCVEAGEREGSRGRVIALARMVRQEMSHREPPIVFIIDRDLSLLLGERADMTGLLLTDYACTEGYLCTPSVLERFCQLVLSGQVSGEKLFQWLSGHLAEMYLIRCAFRRCCEEAQVLAPSKGIEMAGGRPRFNRDRYLEASLVSRGYAPHVDAVVKDIESLRERLPGDIRLSMNGHDFVDLIRVFIGRTARPPAMSRANLERMLMLAGDDGKLVAEPMFVELSRRIQID